MPNHRSESQRGAVLPLVGIVLAVLLGFAGLVIDLGGLFVAKTELQSALDSCALAAVHELDGAPDALARATNAGMTAGNANKVEYQDAAAGITASDIEFSDSLTGTFSSAFAPVANARYARCTHTTDSIASQFIQVLGGPTSSSVGAVAVATRTHAQSACPIPVGLLPKTSGAYPDYGYVEGEWVTLLFGASPSPGEMGWYNLNGSTDANETKKEMAGYCGSKIEDILGSPVHTPGTQAALEELWNARFGIYKNNGNIATMRPDITGYTYTGKNWPAKQNAYAGSPGTCTTPPASCDVSTSENYKAKHAAYASFGDTTDTVASGEGITGLTVNGGFKDVATHGAAGQHKTYGQMRRLVLVPVVASSKIADFACMLMLQPITSPTTPVQLEYLGNADKIGSPCKANGLAGGTAGPLVPALVQ